MLKVYYAHSDVALTIRTIDGELSHISFTTQTMGGSVFFSKDAAVQNAIESHPWFGKKILLREVIDEQKQAEDAKKKAERAARKKQSDDAIVHHVDGLSDAKDYLADRFGISRSKLRTKDAILAVAKENGITLEGLE